MVGASSACTFLGLLGGFVAAVSGHGVTGASQARALLQTWDAALDGTRASAKSTPLTKVVDLLKSMQDTLEKEMDEDQKLYEKLKCWCETNDWEKGNAIEDNKAKIEQLTADIESLSAKKEELIATIKEVQEKTAANKQSLAEAQAIRDKQLKEFHAMELDSIQALEQMKAALTILGKHHGEGVFQQFSPLSLLSVGGRDEPWTTAHERAQVGHALEEFMSRNEYFGLGKPERTRGEFLQHDPTALSASDRGSHPAGWTAEEAAVVHRALKAGAAFVQAHHEQSYYPSYTAQSGEIVGILKQLKDEMEADLSEAQKQEAMRSEEFEVLRKAKTAEIEAGERMEEQKEDELATTANALAEAREDLGQEQALLAENQGFLKNMKETCAEADKNWGQRRKARQAEMEAVAETIAILTEDEARDAAAGEAAAFDFAEVLREDARSKLLDLLDEVTGRKVLMLDSTITGPLEVIVSASDLKDHGVQSWYKLTDQVVQTDCSQMIFLVRCARVELVEWIAAQILADEAQGRDRMYVVVLIPRRTEQVAEGLGRANVRANVRIVECALHYFPFDKDVLSMEVPGVFSEFHVQGDPSSVFYAAKGLMHLQSMFGVVPTIHSIGVAGKAVMDTIVRLRKEEAAGQARPPPRMTSQPGVPPVAPRPKRQEGAQVAGAPRISELVIIDRRVDLFSVLCSQFTYQALVDSTFGIENNVAKVDSSGWSEEQSKTVRLSPDDPFFQEIRDLHLDKMGPLLQEKARAIQKTFAEKDNVKTTNEMADFVKKFKTAQAARPQLEVHINVATELQNATQTEDYRSRLRLEDDITAQSSQTSLDLIEDYLDDQKPFHEVMRLLCLYSLVNSGVRPKQLDQIKKGIIQSYGFEHLLTISNMQRVGLLRYQQGKSVWPQIKRQFGLFVEDAQAELDISYAYSGYAPLSVRLVQMTKSQPKGWKDSVSLLYGPAQVQQQQPDQVHAAAEPKEAGTHAVVLVCFLGGVTYGELAALRRLSELEGGERKFLVVTTELFNAKKLFDSLRCDEVFKQPLVAAARPAPKEERRGFGFWPGGR